MKQPGFHRSRGTAQNRRHVRQRSALIEAQPNDLTMLARQQVNTPPNLRACFALFQCLRRRNLRSRQVRLPVLGILRPEKR